MVAWLRLGEALPSRGSLLHITWCTPPQFHLPPAMPQRWGLAHHIAEENPWREFFYCTPRVTVNLYLCVHRSMSQLALQWRECLGTAVQDRAPQGQRLISCATTGNQPRGRCNHLRRWKMTSLSHDGFQEYSKYAVRSTQNSGYHAEAVAQNATLMPFVVGSHGAFYPLDTTHAQGGHDPAKIHKAILLRTAY